MAASRRLAAIMFTDVVGSTSMMQQNETQAVATIKRYTAVLRQAVAAHSGKILNDYGDGGLCSFPSAIEAAQCALEMQHQFRQQPCVPLRIGLHIGEIFFEDKKVFGDGVNVASRIQSLGQANTILLSKEFFDKLKNHPEFKAVSLGSFDFKHVDDPVEVFAIANEGLVVPAKKSMEGKLNEIKKNNAVRRNVIVAASVLIAVVAAYFLYLKYSAEQNDEIEKSIAIIPFKNISNDPQQEYFAEGMMDEILNHLYKIGGLNVISRTSSMVYKDSKKTSKEIANELGVANLLEGSVQKEGDRIRIIVELIDGKNDKHLWVETYNREFKDVFSIQSEIAQQIAAALKVKIDPGVKERIEKKPTQNTEAYNLYLQAIDPNALFDPNNPFRKSMSLLEAAITLDTTFAEAYAELAVYWLFLGSHLGNLSSQEVLLNADPLLQKALKLNPNLASAHSYVAYMHLWYKWDFETVQNEYQKVLQLNPSNPELAGGFEGFLLATGRFGEALNISTGAFTKDSTSIYNRIGLAEAYYYNNKPAEALQIIKPVASLFEKDDWLMINYIKINLYAGQYKDVIVAFEKYKMKFGSALYPIVLSYAAIAYYKTGQKDSTEKFLNKIIERSKRSPVGSPSYFIAAIYTGMGRDNEAIKWLHKAYADHEVEMFWLKVEPLFKPLHNDSRFQNLIAKIGFPR